MPHCDTQSFHEPLVIIPETALTPFSGARPFLSFLFEQDARPGQAGVRAHFGAPWTFRVPFRGGHAQRYGRMAPSAPFLQVLIAPHVGPARAAHSEAILLIHRPTNV
jgi:hypothetical protein